MFAHCADAAQAWDTFHAVACLCHPAQGGSADDMRALCAQAREALGDAWPWEGDHVPNMFDVYCAAKGLPNPFGDAGIAGAAHVPLSAAAEVAAYDPAASPFGPLTGAGRLVLAHAGSAGSD